jgi:hypothetical protein
VGVSEFEGLARSISKREKSREEIQRAISAFAAEIHEVHAEKMEKLKQAYEADDDADVDTREFDRKTDELKRKKADLEAKEEALNGVIGELEKSFRKNQYWLDLKNHKRSSKKLAQLRGQQAKLRTEFEAEDDRLSRESTSLANDLQRLELSIRKYSNETGPRDFPQEFQRDLEAEKAQHEARIQARRNAEICSHILDRLSSSPRGDVAALLKNYGEKTFLGKDASEIATMSPQQFRELAQSVTATE